MSRRRWPIAGLGAAALAGAIGAALLLGGWLDEGATSVPRAGITARATVSPRSHLFGDDVTARLDLLFSTARVSPSSVRVEVSFTPYRVDVASRSSSHEGAMTRFSYVFRLSCLTSACLANGERLITLPHARVSYSAPAGGGPGVASVAWPALTTASRLASTDPKQLPLRLRTPAARLPAPTYRLTPALLEALALGGAIVLLVVAAALLLTVAPESLRLPARLRRRPRSLSPLERALARVRAASANGAGNERRALELLAVELSGSGELDLAGDARRLAWSPGRPPAEDVGELASRVETLIGRPG
jgi:hypothetical protein